MTTITETIPESKEVEDGDNDEIVHLVCEFCYPEPFEQYDLIPTLCGRAADPQEHLEDAEGPFCQPCVKALYEHKKVCP